MPGTGNVQITSIAADGLPKKSLFGHISPLGHTPQSFAVLTVDGDQTNETTPIASTSPCWSEKFLLRANEHSTLKVQIFDQRRLKRSDKGFLGQAKINVGRIIDLQSGGEKTISISLVTDIEFGQPKIIGRLNIGLATVPRRIQPPVSPRRRPTPVKKPEFDKFIDDEGRQLPSGWERMMDKNGKTYFVDHNDKKTTRKSPVMDTCTWADEEEDQNDIRARTTGYHGLFGGSDGRDESTFDDRIISSRGGSSRDPFSDMSGYSSARRGNNRDSRTASSTDEPNPSGGLRSTQWQDVIQQVKTLFQQKSYSEAQLLLDSSIKECAELLGGDHIETLELGYWLGCAYYEQDRYRDAEEYLLLFHGLQQAKLSDEHPNTLSSKHALGCVYFKQLLLQKAETLLQQAEEGRVMALGPRDPATIETRDMLKEVRARMQRPTATSPRISPVTSPSREVRGESQASISPAPTETEESYTDINIPSSAAFDRIEETVSTASRDVPSHTSLAVERAKAIRQHYAGQTYFPGPPSDIEIPSGADLSRVVQAEAVPATSRDVPLRASPSTGKDPLPARGDLEHFEASHALASPDASSQISPKLTAQPPVSMSPSAEVRLSDFFPDSDEARTSYTDHEIQEISRLLEQIDLSSSKISRAYIVLRNIGGLDHIQKFIEFGFSDYWFPVSERSLPDSLSPKLRYNFINAQKLVITKSMDLEKGENGRHRHFQQGDLIPFETKEVLGKGGFGQVERVVSQISFKEYARKRVSRTLAFQNHGVDVIRRFVAEIEIMKKLKHHHIVEFVGSYTDTKYMCLIMTPIAEMDLSTYLTGLKASQHPELRTFYGCLATALRFLHDKQVRHKDIKPANILVNQGNVLLTDFGLSVDFEDKNGSTTVGISRGITYRYCAPEVFATNRPRNTASDIWSLGVVFFEMTYALKGFSFSKLLKEFEKRQNKEPYIRTNFGAFKEIVNELKGAGMSADNKTLDWIEDMLQLEHSKRPTAASMATRISSKYCQGTGDIAYCAICCGPQELSPSSSDELDDCDFVDCDDGVLLEKHQPIVQTIATGTIVD